MSDPFTEYFAQYPSYPYVPERDWRQVNAFNGLAMQLNWSQECRDLEYENFKGIWPRAIEGEFAEPTLEHYQNLCEQLRGPPIPQSIKECKKKLYFVNVNLVDLMQYRRDIMLGYEPEPLRFFDTVEELQDYSRNTNKFCPVDVAKAKLLRPLLKPMSD